MDVLVGDDVVPDAGLGEEGVEVGVRREVPAVGPGPQVEHRPAPRAEHHPAAVGVLLVVRPTDLGVAADVLVLGSQPGAGADEVGTVDQLAVVGVGDVRAASPSAGRRPPSARRPPAARRTGCGPHRAGTACGKRRSHSADRRAGRRPSFPATRRRTGRRCGSGRRRSAPDPPSTPGPSRPSAVRSRPESGAGGAPHRVRDRRPRRWRGCPSAVPGPSVEWPRRRRAPARRGARRSDRRQVPGRGAAARPSRPTPPGRSPPPAHPARSGRAPGIGSGAPPRRPSPSAPRRRGRRRRGTSGRARSASDAPPATRRRR